MSYATLNEEAEAVPIGCEGLVRKFRLQNCVNSAASV